MNITHRLQLPHLMKHLNLPMVAIELGCSEGYSAKDFLEQGVEKIYMVDLWATIAGQSGDASNKQEWHDNNYNLAMDRVRRFGDKVEVRRGLTQEMAFYILDNIAGLVYIDANHEFSAVYDDITTYWPKLVSGGICALHDYENNSYGVKEAVQKFAKENNLEVHLLAENKKEDAGAYFFKP